MSFYNIGDFINKKENSKLNDKQIVERVIEKRKQLSKKIFENFKNNLSLPNSLLWEYSVKLPLDLDKEKSEILKKYFVIKDWKIYPRWWAYYFLFWDFYKQDSKSLGDKESAKLYFLSFKEELFRFLDDFEKIIDIDWIEYVVLDNLRNMILYLINFILLVYKNTLYSTVFGLPFRFHLKNFSKDKIERLLKLLIDNYKLVIDDLFRYVFYHWKGLDIKNLVDKDKIKEIFKEIKSVFKLIFEWNIFERRWIIWNFFQVYDTFQSVNQFFRNLNRNYREEDNLFVILATLLQKDVNVLDKLIKTRVNFDDIKNIFMKRISNSFSNKIVVAILYWGIEYWLLAEYFSLPVIFVNYSRYNLWQKDKFKLLDILSRSNDIEKLDKNKEVIIFDDDTQTWNTIKDVETFFKVNGVSVISVVWRNILLSKKKPNYFNWDFIKDDVGDNDLLFSLLLRSFSFYYKWDRKLYPPIEHKKRQLKRYFGRVIKDF